MNPLSHILLIEDNPADSHLVAKVLKEKCPDSSLFVAEDGSTGSDYVFRRGAFGSAPTPQLILLDLNLPGKDGREVLREIKNEAKLKAIPVVMFTSSEAEVDIDACYAAGANAYFSKPSDLDEFTGLIEMIYQHWVRRVKLPSHLGASV